MSMNAPRHPSVRELKHFRFLDDLTDDQLTLLAKSLRVRKARKRTRLIEIGARENFSLFLLKGELLLDDGDGTKFKVYAGNELASGPIAAEIPRMFDVICLKEIEYLEVDNHLLADLRVGAKPHQEPQAGFFPAEDSAGSADEMIAVIRDDLERDRLLMPSLPDVAVRVGKAMRDDSTDAQDLAAIIQSDPAITAKLIRVSNNAFYATPNPAGTCAEAVMRLGFNTTHKLVIGFALREVFRTNSPVLQKRMRELWQHSVKVAAVCFVLAQLTRRFDPEHALLCGLVHDIGMVSLISYSARYPAVAEDKQRFDQILQAFRGDISQQILDRWKFPHDLVACAGSAEDWGRDMLPEPDYCDLLVAAQVYSYLGSEREKELPDLNEVPAFRKLELGELTPERKLEVIEPARERLALVEQMLSA